MEILRAGIVGCGLIATEAHLAAFRSLPDVEVVAISDLSLDRMAQYAGRLGRPGVRMYTDYRELLAQSDVDFISAAVPPGVHHRVVMDAARAGKHVLCEKPIAASLKEADEMIAAMRDHGRHFAIYNNYLFFPDTRCIQDVVRSGSIGQVRRFYIQAWGLGMDVEDFMRYEPVWEPWKYDTLISGGGLMMDFGVHTAYLSEAYMGRPVRRLEARMERITQADIGVEDYILVRLDFDGGYGTLDLSWHPAVHTDTRLLQSGSSALLGEKGLVEIAYRGRGEGPHSPVEKVSVRTAEGEAVHLMPFVDSTRSKLIASFAGAIRTFAEGIRSGRRDTTSAELGRRGLEIVLASYQSAALEVPVELPLPPDSPVYQLGVRGIAQLGPSVPKAAVVRQRNLYGLNKPRK